jgi:hypothetical protein
MIGRMTMYKVQWSDGWEAENAPPIDVEADDEEGAAARFAELHDDGERPDDGECCDVTVNGVRYTPWCDVIVTYGARKSES